MKSTGIVRRIDDLGRVVIPKDIRRSLDLKEGDPMEICVNGRQVIFEKYEPNYLCHFCGSDVNVIEYMGKGICVQCRQNIADEDTAI